MRMLVLAAALAAAFLFPATARAESGFRPTAAVSNPFATIAETDAVLAEVRGTAGVFAVLTRGKLVSINERQSLDTFAVTGSIARVEMDIWWGSTGAELIAANVRASLP